MTVAWHSNEALLTPCAEAVVVKAFRLAKKNGDRSLRFRDLNQKTRLLFLFLVQFDTTVLEATLIRIIAFNRLGFAITFGGQTIG